MNDPESPENGTQQAPKASPRNHGKLERPGVRRRLQHECARGEKTNVQLGREYNCDESSIREFKQRHQDRIEEIARDIENEFAGMWIADKMNRLDQLQDLYTDDVAPRERETRAALLRAAAEELGQIPNRTTVDFTQPVEIVITGSDDV